MQMQSLRVLSMCVLCVYVQCFESILKMAGHLLKVDSHWKYKSFLCQIQQSENGQYGRLLFQALCSYMCLCWFYQLYVAAAPNIQFGQPDLILQYIILAGFVRISEFNTRK